MASGPLVDLLTVTATHRANAWLLCVSAGAVASFVPLLFPPRAVARDRAREAIVLAAGLAGGALGATLLPVLLRAPAAIATRSLTPLLVGDRMAIGALLGFAGLVALAARQLDIAPARALDRLAPSMGVLVVLGRIGCFLEGCDFGAVTAAPWAVTYPPTSHAFEHQLAQGLVRATDAASLPVHPAQLYEAIAGVAMIVIAVLVQRARRRDGDAFRAALAVYAAARFVVEAFRGDARGQLGPLSVPQWMAIALLAWLAAGLFAERPRLAPRA